MLQRCSTCTPFPILPHSSPPPILISTLHLLQPALTLPSSSTPLSLGFNHSVALTASGTVYVWGAQMSSIPTPNPAKGGLLTHLDQHLP
ncbi:hypothetical protein EON65_51590, partial [archaeon]